MTSIWEIESLVNLKNKLKNILISRKVDVSDDDNLSTLVDKVNDVRDNVELNALLSGDLTEFKSESLTELKAYAFSNCIKLTKIDIPNCINIANQCFNTASSLEKIEILKSGSVGATSTFYSCTSLKKVILPLFVASSASSMFQNCSKLQLIDINTIKLDYQSLNGCNNLKTLIYRRTSGVNSISSISLLPTNFQSNGFLYVPENLLDSYKTTTNWSTMADRIIKLEGTIYEDVYWSKKDMMFIFVDSIEYEIPKDTTVLQYKNTYQIEHLYSDGTELTDDKLLYDYISTTITTEVG
jgi:hypothetical protein